MKHYKWLGLQFFAGEGAGDGGGEGAATGETAGADAGQKLRELGVPEDKIRRRARYAAKAPETAPAKAEPVEQKAVETKVQDAAAENPTEEKRAEAPTRMSWDEIMADPEYNKQMQAVVQSRLRTAKNAEEHLAKITPALEVLARKYNQDPSNVDYDALAKAINNDDAYYEDKALQMGTTLETAKRVDQLERDDARRRKAEEQTLQEQKIRNHFISLEQQGEVMKKTYPQFDLSTELKNPVFARMTSPNIGISVETAYYAVHRAEIEEASKQAAVAAMQATAKATAQQISNSIQAGARRPDENGVSGQAPSVTSFDYRNASRDQRESLKKRIRDAAARGEKLYPGQ